VVDLLEAMARAGGAARVALFGHNPQLSALARRLRGEDMELRTGEAVGIAFAGDVEAGAGRGVDVLRMEGE
jgi:phosphohistidine phosphatase SixA